MIIVAAMPTEPAVTPNRAVEVIMGQVELQVLHLRPQAVEVAFHAFHQLLHMAKMSVDVPMSMFGIFDDVREQVLRVVKQVVKLV